MSKYIVKVSKSIEGSFIVEAESEEDANSNKQENNNSQKLYPQKISLQ